MLSIDVIHSELVECWMFMDGHGDSYILTQTIVNNICRVVYLFSALTFLPHLEHVYILSPSNMSLTVTSSKDSYNT